jgi:raffinose/stachyose/melibiose transport system substrate-binding protein
MTALAIAAALVGCGKGQGSGNTVTLRLMTGWGYPKVKTAVDGLIADFENEHPRIHIEHQALDDQSYPAALRASFTSGDNLPDIYETEYEYAGYHARAGNAMDLTDWVKAHQDRFQHEGFVDSQRLRKSGRVYGVPYSAVNMTQVFYNVDLLKKHGISPPRSWQEFLDACARLKKAGVTPIALGAKSEFTVAHWGDMLIAKQAGLDVVDKVAEGNLPWDNPDFARGLERLAELRKLGYLSPGCVSDGYMESMAYWISGRAAFFHTGSWLVAEIIAPKSFHWDFFAFPDLPGGKAQTGENVAVANEGFQVAAKTKHPKECLAFIEYITRPEVAAKHWVAIGKVSPIRGANEKASAKVRKVAELIAAGKRTVPYGLMRHIDEDFPEEAERAFAQYLIGMLAGNRTPRQVLQAVDAARKARRR